jgi:hypothetical protein
MRGMECGQKFLKDKSNRALAGKAFASEPPLPLTLALSPRERGFLAMAF